MVHHKHGRQGTVHVVWCACVRLSGRRACGVARERSSSRVTWATGLRMRDASRGKLHFACQTEAHNAPRGKTFAHA